MLVLASQVRCSPVVSPQLDFLELRNGDPQSLAYSPKTRSSRSIRRLRELFEKISSEWIIRMPDRTIRLAHELGNNVQIPN